MEWVLLVLLLPLGFFFFVGLFVPAVAGERVMKKALRRCGVPVKLLPKEFIRESTVACLERAEELHSADRSKSKRGYFISLLQDETYAVCRILEMTSAVSPAQDASDDTLLVSATAERMRKFRLL